MLRAQHTQQHTPPEPDLRNDWGLRMQLLLQLAEVRLVFFGVFWCFLVLLGVFWCCLVLFAGATTLCTTVLMLLIPVCFVIFSSHTHTHTCTAFG